MSTPEQVELRVTRDFTAAPEPVFAAWLDPVLIRRWMFGPAVRDEEVLRISLDPRVGGWFSFVVRREGEEVAHAGEYREIDPPRRLLFTWGVDIESEGESLVSVEIERLDAGSRLTLVHRLHPRWAEQESLVRSGWTGMLDALDGVLRRDELDPGS